MPRGLHRRLLLLVCLGLLAYGNSLFLPFVHDDLVFIRYNRAISDLSHWPALFLSPPALAWGSDVVNPYYRPVLELAYRVLYRFFQFQPMGYHFFNVLMHMANAVLIFFIMRRILESMYSKSSAEPDRVSSPDALAWCVASVFLVHPVQTEAVTCISGISNLLYTFFCLISFWLYINLSKNNAKVFWYVLSLGAYLLALFSKEQAIFLPFLVLAYDGIMRLPWKTKGSQWSWGLGFLGVTGVYLVWRKLILHAGLTAFLQYRGELLLRLAAIPSTLLMYMRVILFPFDLHYYRSIDILAQRGAWQLVLFFFGVVGMLYGLRRLSKPQVPGASFGLAWFILALLPVLNIVPMVHEYSWIAAFEHFLYFPLAGFVLFGFVLLGRLIFLVFKTKSNMVYTTGMSLVIITCMGFTFTQNNFWRNEVALFERAVRYEQNLGRLRFLLARSYLVQGEYEKAQGQLQRAAAIMEGYLAKVRLTSARELYLNYLRQIYGLLAYSFEARQDHPRAIMIYQKLIPLSSKPQAIYRKIGSEYLRIKDFDLAVEYFMKSLVSDQLNIETTNDLAFCYIQKGDYAKAESFLKKILDIRPDDPTALKNLKQIKDIRTKAGMK